MKMFDMLKKEHDEVRELFEQCEKDEDKNIFLELRTMLLQHMMGEESTLYPLMLDNDDTRKDGIKSEEEHDAARHMIDMMDESEDDERWMARFLVLKEQVEHHLEEEEENIFAKAEGLVKEAGEDALIQQFMEIRSGEAAGA